MDLITLPNVLVVAACFCIGTAAFMVNPIAGFATVGVMLVIMAIISYEGDL